MQISDSVATSIAAAGTNPSAASASSANPAVVTANDFLTLLVSELKNQDPTANTDPTAYVNQLVQVNSLQQLIQISQNTNAATTASGNSGTAA